MAKHVQDTDARLTNARTPTAHAATHGSGGTDALTLAIAQITDLSNQLAAKYSATNKPTTADLGAVPTTRTITAGTGLSGGGDLTADRTLTVAYGTTAGTAAQGNDSRLSDARTPTSHTHPVAQVSDSTTTGRAVVTAVDAAAARTAIGAGTSNFDGAYGSLSGRPTLGTAAAANTGTGVADVILGNDTRLTNARTPTAHAATHASGGTDAITVAQSQVTNLTTDLAAKYSATNKVPATGLSATGTADATTFLRGDNTWAVPAGGSGGAGPTLPLTTEYNDTTPAAPTSGVTLFARHRARRMLAMIGPTGLDTQLQPAIFSNRIARWTAVNGSATPTQDGVLAVNVTSPTAVSVTTNSFYNSMVRARFPSVTQVGNAAGFRTNPQWHLSATANKGGFFFVCRFGLNLVTATNRLFVGLSATNANLTATSEPSTAFNQIGFGCDSTQTTMRFFRNDGTGASTAVDLGANFSTTTAGQATNFYEVRLFAPSGGGANVFWSAQRLNDGAFVQGSATTDLPANDLILAAHVWHSNGTTAAAVNLDVQSLYIETDN